MRILVTIAFFLVYIQCIGQKQPGFWDYVKKEQHAFKLRNRAISRSTASDIDYTFIEAKWNINPEFRYINGSIRYITKFNEENNQIRLQISKDLIIDSIISDYNNLQYLQTFTDEVLITTPVSIQKDSTFEFSIYYQGTPPSSGHGSFSQNAHLMGDVIWTLSEPYGSKDWWPSPNNLIDKFDSISISITSPIDYFGVSNGLLIDSIITDSTRTTIWKHNYPIANYLIAIAVSNYIEYSHKVKSGNDSLLIQNFLYPLSKEKYEAIIPELEQMFNLFDSLFTEYPFKKEKYGHTEFSWGGGMEHQTNSFMGNFGFELTAHELAHQWFGNKITCGSWEDLWLNEGFASYATILCYEHLINGIYWIPAKRLHKEDILSKSDGSVIVSDTSDISRLFNGRLTYRKGAMVLHALRNYVGDSLFYKSIRDYISDSSLIYGFSKTPQLTKHFNNNCPNKNIDQFFNSWIYSEGHPEFKILYEQVENQLNIHFSQKGSTTETFFPCAVNLKLNNSVQKFFIDSNSQQFHLEFNEKLDSIKFDPEHDLIASAEIKSFNFQKDNFEIYSNIQSESITIHSKSDSLGANYLTIVNSAGQTIWENQIFNITFPLTIPINHLKRGTYTVFLSKNNILTMRKNFIKM